MILSLLSFPSPPSALCTIFGERGLPCPAISPCSSLSPCPISSGPSLFFLPWGALGGGGACCCGEGVEERAGQGEGRWEWGRRTLSPPSPGGGGSWLKGGSCRCRCAWCWWFWPLASAGPHIPVCPGRSCMLFDGMLAFAGAAAVSLRVRAKERHTGLQFPWGGWAGDCS